MPVLAQSTTVASFSNFGDLLKYLRRRARLTQLELSIAVGYSEAQISRLEKNQRLPDLTALKALFLPALHLENDPELAARLLNLANAARQEDAPVPGIPPYKGLLFFDEADADLFFGREALVAHLVDRANHVASHLPRLLAVVGASGSGKSSVVRAGLAVTLKRAGWDTRVFTPTAEPLKMIEANHAREHGNGAPRLIVVDQFEEVFTLCHDEAARAAFIEKLLALASEPNERTMIVIALRADFYSHCAAYPQLRQAIASQQEYIGPMSPEELRRAIEEPAKRGGWEFESGLVESMLNDIGARSTQDQEPGALPLLSHALLATWERRRGRTFTVEGYRAAGGVRGAIAETAESVFTDQLDRQQQHLARDIFLRLTELGEGTEDMRRRAALIELVPSAEQADQVRSILSTLADARLVSLGQDSAEIAHEALIREWQRLREWLNQDRESLRLHRQFTQAAREWEELQRDPGALYRGVRLIQMLEWEAENPDSLNDQERVFLAASKAWAEGEAAERARRHQLDRRPVKSLYVETPLWESQPLSAVLGVPVFLKMEAFQPSGSFKARGMGAACRAAAERGAQRVVCASGGNAGYAVAFAGRQLGLAVTIVVPETTSPRASELIRSEGANLIVHGASWDDAHAYALDLTRAENAVYIHPFDDPNVWRGHASMIREIANEGIRPGAIVLSVGGGGLLCGVLEGLHDVGWTDLPVLAVETEGAASFAAAVKAGQLVTLDKITSLATTLGARTVARQALEWTQRHPVIPWVVSDRAAVEACLRFADDHRILVEPACGAALAVGYERAQPLEGKSPVVIIVCGGAGVNREQLERWKGLVN